MSQRSEPAPSPINKILQPYLATSKPPIKGPIAGPAFAPASTNAFRNPLGCSAKFVAMIFEIAGYATDSPAPRMNRNSSSIANPEQNPVRSVAADQTKNPAA